MTEGGPPTHDYDMSFMHAPACVRSYICACFAHLRVHLQLELRKMGTHGVHGGEWELRSLVVVPGAR